MPSLYLGVHEEKGIMYVLYEGSTVKESYKADDMNHFLGCVHKLVETGNYSLAISSMYDFPNECGVESFCEEVFKVGKFLKRYPYDTYEEYLENSGEGY